MEMYYSSMPLKENKIFSIETHRHANVFVIRGIEDCIATINITPGKMFCGELLLRSFFNDKMYELRVWNPFRSKLAAAILNGIDSIGIIPGNKVLYLGASTGTTISHISDIVGSKGCIYGVEYSNSCAYQLFHLSTQRTNIIPIIDDARYPLRYKMLVPMVDVAIIDVSQKDQIEILAINTLFFLKTGGNIMVTLKSDSIDSISPEILFAKHVDKLRKFGFSLFEQITLEPYERGHMLIRGKLSDPVFLFNQLTRFTKLIN
mmetsp:Transcript_32050/g.44688  ORF Transcript_32050/g.44688 Transcript_32050/m.44688 type:complete len:261 (-) Transcript_32050:543-1325(-)